MAYGLRTPLPASPTSPRTLNSSPTSTAIRHNQNTAILGSVYQTLLPKRRRAWASWSYHVGDSASDVPIVTYWMNRLQGLPHSTNYFVTLNCKASIDPSKILRTIQYEHPAYTMDAVKAQERFVEVDGLNHVHFCGAYWGYGFHEDGVKCGIRVAERVLNGMRVTT